jgi:oligosaccharyltransferase complex subunit alpha (ribophorin I)
VTTLLKEITVSHWGNIYVDERYEIRHAGAKHNGAFSRLKYSYQHGVGASFREVRAKLPASAHSIYYT